MKKLIYIFIITIVLCNNYVFSQNDTLQQVFDDIKNQYDALDHTGMTSNLLFNKGFIVLNQLEEWHNGNTVITLIDMGLFTIFILLLLLIFYIFFELPTGRIILLRRKYTHQIWFWRKNLSERHRIEQNFFNEVWKKGDKGNG